MKQLALATKPGHHPFAPARRAPDQPSPAPVATPSLAPPPPAAASAHAPAQAQAHAAAAAAAQGQAARGQEGGVKEALLCRVKEVLAEVLVGVPAAFRERPRASGV